jgi:hypothetical protein
MCSLRSVTQRSLRQAQKHPQKPGEPRAGASSPNEEKKEESQPADRDALDAYIAAQIRDRRIVLGLTQDALGKKLVSPFNRHRNRRPAQTA